MNAPETQAKAREVDAYFKSGNSIPVDMVVILRNPRFINDVKELAKLAQK